MNLLLRRPDRTYLVNPGDRLETDLGIIEVPQDIAPGEHLESHLGTAFLVTKPRMTDLFHQLDRAGAPMVPRDIGLVLGMTGLASGDSVLDIGTGTGLLAIAMARLGIEVVTYEQDPDIASVARENLDRSGVGEEVELRVGDATSEELPEGLDAMTLDTGDAPTLVEKVPEVLIPGGTVVAYTPFVEYAREVSERAGAVGCTSIRTFETIQRTMDFDDRGSRPSTAPVGHTGYLTVAEYVPGID